MELTDLYRISELIDDKVALLSFGRQDDKGNRFNCDLVKALDLAIDEVTSRQFTGVVLRSNRGVFSRGADDDWIRNASLEEALEFIGKTRLVFQKFHDFPGTSVACLDGLAWGGGAELALACHYRVMSTLATICLPETSKGIIPGWGGLARLVWMLGLRPGLEIVLSARQMKSSEAQELGLVDFRVVPDKGTDSLLRVAWEVASGAPRRSLTSPQTKIELTDVEIEELLARHGKGKSQKALLAAIRAAEYGLRADDILAALGIDGNGFNECFEPLHRAQNATGTQIAPA